MATILFSTLAPGMDVSGRVHECRHCGAWFVARKDARYCSHRCLMAYRRKTTKQEQPAK
jgi:hypothetical protein